MIETGVRIDGYGWNKVDRCDGGELFDEYGRSELAPVVRFGRARGRGSCRSLCDRAEGAVLHCVGVFFVVEIDAVKVL